MGKFGNFKEIENSQVIITIKDGESINEHGQKVIHVKKKVLAEPLNLGSANNPIKHPDILRIECKIPEKQDLDSWSNMMRRFFK